MRAAKVDANHGAIRDHLKTKGWSVLSLARLGNGAPDLLVGRRGFSALVEVKSSVGKRLREGQQLFARSWNGVCIKAVSPVDAETQLDRAEKYQYLRHPPAYIERPEDYDPEIKIKIKPTKAPPEDPAKILRMLGK